MSAFASFMLIAWVPITAVIFARMAPAKAVVVTILWGYLLLPENTGLNLPVLPTLDKHLIPALSATLFYWLARRKEENQIRLARRRGLAVPEEETSQEGLTRTASRSASLSNMIIVILLASCVLTYLTNRQIEIFGPRIVRAMSTYDLLSLLQTTFLMVLPFWLARRALMTRDMLAFILRAFVYAGLFYSLLILFEARMSPQLNKWIYGFFPHDWRQHIRGGHFRPIVFLEHGLRVGIFMALSTLAAAVLFRIDPDRKKRLRWVLAVLWFLPVLFVSRNSGAMLLTLLFVPIVLLFSARLQLLIAAALSAVVLLYPMARGAGLVPIDTIMAQAAKLSAERAQSLEFRLDNEDLLLERAAQKPLSGWGMWARNWVYDRDTGESLTVVDGTWIITIGERGWIGYLGLFSLFCLPPILLALRRSDRIGLLETGLCLMLTVNTIDMIPNSSMQAHLWILCGALWGRLGWRDMAQPEDAPAQRRRPSRAKRTRKIRPQSRRPGLAHPLRS